MQEMFWIVEELLASEEGICATYLVS